MQSERRGEASGERRGRKRSAASDLALGFQGESIDTLGADRVQRAARRVAPISTSMSQPTPYPELNAVLDALVERVRAALEDTLVGVYLQGSFAVGDFDEHSDVDFIVVMTKALTDQQVARLQQVHAAIYDLESEWAKHLEGSYFPRATIHDLHAPRERLWYLDHGSKSLVRSDHCNTLVVRTVLREMGVPLIGPRPETLLESIPVEPLRREIATTMRDWGQQILDNPGPYRNRFYQGYIVLSYCRMLHDLIEGRPGSKRAGARWAKVNLHASWSDLIDSAWSCRPNPALAVRQPPDDTDFERTLQFVRYVNEMAETTIASTT